MLARLGIQCFQPTIVRAGKLLVPTTDEILKPCGGGGRGGRRGDWEKRGLDPGKDAILVAGDFNCSLRNPEFAKERTIRGLLKEGWVSATERIPWPEAATVRPDQDGKYPAADFDHILLSPGWVALLRSEPPRGRSFAGFKAGVDQDSNVPSDHWPVVLRMKD